MNKLTLLPLLIALGLVLTGLVDPDAELVSAWRRAIAEEGAPPSVAEAERDEAEEGGESEGEEPGEDGVLDGVDGSTDAEDEDEDEDAGDDESEEGKTWVMHEVVPAEDIAALALRYRVDPGKIRAWNGLGARAKIRPGQRLRILARRTPPPRELRRHLVIEGESWSSIGRAYGVDASDLRVANAKRVGRRLRPGVELEVWIDPPLYAAITGDTPPPGLAGTIRPGAFASGRPHAGRLINGVQIPEGEDYELRYPASAWGTTSAVRATVTALHAWREATGYEGRLTLGAMSRQRGRKIGGHLSHQNGRDLDIRLPLRAELRQDLDPLPRRVDWMAVWELVRSFEASGEITRIFLDYAIQKRLYKAAKEAGISRSELRRVIQFPRGSKAPRGLIRHSPGHDIHLHVRFRCAEHELECAGR